MQYKHTNIYIESGTLSLTIINYNYIYNTF